MDGLEAMKGQGQQLLCIRRQHREFKLFRFRDGSFAVHRDGKTVGLWEAHHQEAAIQTLAQLLGLPGGGRTISLVPPEPDAFEPALN
jgi:hypothetical protein